MNRRHTLALAAALLTTMPLVARAADYPEKPMAFIVPCETNFWSSNRSLSCTIMSLNWRANWPISSRERTPTRTSNRPSAINNHDGTR